MANKKANIQYFEFTCGCRVKKDQAKRRKLPGTKIVRYACKKHKKPVKQVCILCPDCEKEFFVNKNNPIRCPKCTAKRREKLQAVVRKKQQKKRLKFGRNEKPTSKKPKLKTSEILCGATCIWRSDCLERFLKDGTIFKCVGCTRFKAIDIDDYMSTGKDGAETNRNYTLDRF